MGPAWVWFTVAVLAAIAGGLLLATDYGRRTAHARERRRWAALRGWRFIESDPVLPDRWRHGVMAHGGAGEARDLVTGRLFTPDGRRTVHVFDHQQGGKVTGVLTAVARRTPFPATVELWLPDSPFHRDPGLQLVGPIGARQAFADALAAARPLVNSELAAVCEDIGRDVPVVWLEDAWVLASAPPGAIPARLEQLLRHLGEIADLVDRRIDGALARAGAMDGETAHNGAHDDTDVDDGDHPTDESPAQQ